MSRPRQDVNPHCQAALLARGGGAESCVFGDLTERAPAARVVAGLPWLMAGRLVLASQERQSAWCAKHGALCKPQPAEVEVAGPTCTDFSPEGKRRGVDGPTMPVFWAWARLQRANPALRVIIFLRMCLSFLCGCWRRVLRTSSTCTPSCSLRRWLGSRSSGGNVCTC